MEEAQQRRNRTCRGDVAGVQGSEDNRLPSSLRSTSCVESLLLLNRIWIFLQVITNNKNILSGLHVQGLKREHRLRRNINVKRETRLDLP